MKGTSCERMYQDLGLKYLHKWGWVRRLFLFYKFIPTKLPAYIYDFVPPVKESQRRPNTFNSFLDLLVDGTSKTLKFEGLVVTIYFGSRF